MCHFLGQLQMHDDWAMDTYASFIQTELAGITLTAEEITRLRQLQISPTVGIHL